MRGNGHVDGDAMIEAAVGQSGQPDRASRIARSVRRLLAAAGYSTIEEMRLPDGRRVDVIALSSDGSIHVVEIKSSLADFRADRKWRHYLDYCDRLFFALDPDTPAHVIPDDVGLIVADEYGAQFIRSGVERRLTAMRRKALTLKFAKAAADRLHRLHDPMWRGEQG